MPRFSPISFSRNKPENKREEEIKKAIFVLTTVPEKSRGEFIAHQLVKEKLAACVTVSSPCLSFYWWEGKIAQDQEFMLIIKTKAFLYPRVEKRLKELHPYKVPEIISLTVAHGSEEYLKWIDEETQS